MALNSVVSDIFNVEKYRDLEILARGHSRSLKVVSFNRLPIVSYSCSIVTLLLRCAVFEINVDFSRKSENFPTPMYIASAALLKG